MRSIFLLLIPVVCCQIWWKDGFTRSARDLTTASPLDAAPATLPRLLPDRYTNAYPILPTAPNFDPKLQLRADDDLPIEVTMPTSPLDEGKPIVDNSNTLQQRSAEQRSLVSDLNNLSQCQKDCSGGLNDALGLMMESMSHVERYQKICQHYNESYTCIAEEKQCGEEDHSTFEMFTSGLRYMCVEQQLAFNATIGCIDNQASIVQSECETTCNTKNVVMNMIMRSSIAQGIQNGLMSGLNGGSMAAVSDASLNGFVNPQPMDMESMRQISGEMCKVGDCVLDCLRSKFNTRCEGSAGTLLSEMFVRPIAASQDRMTMISPVMGMFVPQPCNFLYSKGELLKHRIDPTMDDELKRMYNQREQERLEQLANGTLEDAAMRDALLFTLAGAPSPFDSDVDIAELVDQLYRTVPDGNETDYDDNTANVTDVSGAVVNLNQTDDLLSEMAEIEATTSSSSPAATTVSATSSLSPVIRQPPAVADAPVSLPINEEADVQAMHRLDDGQGDPSLKVDMEGSDDLLTAMGSGDGSSGELFDDVIDIEGSGSGDGSGVEMSSGMPPNPWDSVFPSNLRKD